MIVCPNCNHPNPDGAVQCEACYTPLPKMTNCPNCGTTVQTDASFCGQCGFNLHAVAGKDAASPVVVANDLSVEIPPLVQPDPLPHAESVLPPKPNHDPALPAQMMPLLPDDLEEEPAIAKEEPAIASAPPTLVPAGSKTQLQQQVARLVHVQTDTLLELPHNLGVIHIGKPNDRIPPDIDVSGFPDTEIVSRIHADIRVEADAFYLEDVGSSNGTYVNNVPLPMGNRHRLRPGDRIALGKGDKVTFLFQLS